MIVTLSRIPAVTSAPKCSRRLRSLSLGVLLFLFQKRLLLFPRLCPPSKTLFFSFPAVILHLPRRGYPHSRTLFFSYRDVVSLCFGVLQDGECGMVVDGRVFEVIGQGVRDAVLPEKAWTDRHAARFWKTLAVDRITASMRSKAVSGQPLCQVLSDIPKAACIPNTWSGSRCRHHNLARTLALLLVARVS
jgi:hypothetical protein